MQSELEERLGFQPDIYQRYAFLAQIVERVFRTVPEAVERCRLLDVGSGPARLTETFLPAWVEVTRTDVGTFDDPAIIQIAPDGSLPFPDDSFDIVLAMDVIEHVPEGRRAGLIAECRRVAARAVVIAGPVRTPEVEAAERAFARLARAVSGRDLLFLAEHAQFGLPDADSILEWLSGGECHVVTVDNSPLAEWQVFNAIDFIYSSDLGEGEPKHATNARINSTAPFRRPGGPHYRKFFCGFRRDQDAALMRQFMEAATPGGPLSALELAAATTELVVKLHTDLRNASERAGAEKAAHLGRLDERYAGELDALRAAIAEKDAHIDKLGAILKAATDENDAYVSRLTEAEQIIAARGSDLEQLTRDAAALQNELASIRSSRSWKLGAPVRLMGRMVRAAKRRFASVSTWPSTSDTQQTDAYQHAYRLLSSSPLFDPQWYQRNHPEAAVSGDPLMHYVHRREADSPHPLFDARFYLDQNPDVAAAGINPLVHYITCGAQEGRRPHPLFDPAFYRAQVPDLAASGLDALTFYVTHGDRDRSKPHPLFDTTFYLEENPDVAAAAIDPLVHYVTHGALEGRSPHPLFDARFYLEQNPDVAAAGMNPLVHYVLHGACEGRDPHASFDTSYYLEQNPDVAAAGLNPLVHYVTCGARERRRTKPQPIVEFDLGYVPPEGLLPWFNPLAIAISEALSSSPRLNVLVPSVTMKSMSGGPNTAIALAVALAAKGVSIRFLSTDAAVDTDSRPFWDHVRTLARLDRLPPNLELIDAHDRSRPTYVGANDLFMATAWWTAQQVKYATRVTKQQTFLYLIQDYEPLLHAASTQYALASESYDLPHLPLVNTSLLHEFLTTQKVGRFRDEEFARSALVFEPALDQSIFHPATTRSPYAPRRLLFYARPTNGLRNLFEMGVAALQKAIRDGVFDLEDWEFVGMGEPFQPVELRPGAVLRSARWVTLESYARQMRESDVLLSLMLSPHPSYPPLEMAASGGVAVTTTFGNKTEERLSGLSRNIIGVEPTIESIAAGLAAAVRRLPQREQRLRDAHLALPRSWPESFAPILPRLLDELALLQASPSLPLHVRTTIESATGSRVFPGYRGWARNSYDIYRRDSIHDRRATYPTAKPDLLSFLTPVWNTDPVYLEELAESVLEQDGGTNFEWIVLDNGSTRAETRSVLTRLARHPVIRLHRFDENIGIIAGTRFCLESARNRYVVPLDHDDLIAPDAVRVISHALKRFGYPALLYSDEDKLDVGLSRDPYFKPAWDPVLFVNSCYTSHLCAIDRRLALELGTYTDSETEGSPDWDAVTRFFVAGHVPFHVPEVLYTWRMHADSTSGNIQSKPYVFTSQRGVLGRVLTAAAHPELYELQPSPLFHGTPDWWIRRVHRHAWAVTTVVVTPEEVDVSRVRLRRDLPHEIVHLDPSLGLLRLQQIATRCAESGSLVHLLWSDTSIEDEEWPWEAMTHFELFPDTVMIGGRVHDGQRIRMAGRYFGFGSGCDSPDRGRALNDPGYFVQMWKQHSVSAVPVQHCVVRAEFLRDALAPLASAGISVAGIGPWLGAAARKAGRRVVYSPFFCAATGTDLEETVSDVERAAFRSTYSELLPESQYLSPALGLAPATSYRPVGTRARLTELDAASTLPSYSDWLAAEAMARSVRYGADDSHPTISVLTTLYSGSQADVLGETARSLLNQSHPFTEWVILIHGPVAPGVDKVVEDYAADPRVRVIRKPENVGIVNGLRLCLEQASSEFVVPMDADDLLSPDALQVLSCEIRATEPDLIYTDEDVYRDGTAGSPFFRPDFDRVLNAENSYIWHLCAYRREEALRLCVYESAGAEFCHDWDTVCRFARAGGRIVHANHVLYHWRAHSASQSNSGGQNPGSLASTKFVLTRTIEEQSNPSLYQVASFPIFRGAEEWCIRRLPVQPPSTDVFILGEALTHSQASAVMQRCGFPFRAVHDQEPEAAADWPARLRKALDGGAGYVVVLSDGCEDLDQSGIWEAVKLFEMHPDVAIVSGRILNGDGVVIACGSVPDSRSRLVSPFAGLRHTDAGPYAMALKPHCILCPAEGLFVARAEFLDDAIQQRPIDLELSELPFWLGACAIAQNKSVAYSPLIHARARAHVASVLQGEGSSGRFWKFLADLDASGSERLPWVMGTAGFLNARRMMADGASSWAPFGGTRERDKRLEPVSR